MSTFVARFVNPIDESAPIFLLSSNPKLKGLQSKKMGKNEDFFFLKVKKTELPNGKNGNFRSFHKLHASFIIYKFQNHFFYFFRPNSVNLCHLCHLDTYIDI